MLQAVVVMLEEAVLLVLLLAGTGADLANKVQEITYQNSDTALLPCDIRDGSFNLLYHEPV